MTSPSDLLLARRAKKAGAKFSLRIILEAKAAKLPVSVGFALVEQETGFRNVYGHDPVGNRAIKGGKVTKKNYIDVYLRDRKAGKGMQGVGLPQLTWWELQDEADRMGGCWQPKYQLRVAFRHLASLIKTYGTHEGIRRYNGSGEEAERYANQVLARAERWHNILTKS